MTKTDALKFSVEEYFTNLEAIAQTGVVNKVFDKDYKGEPIV